MKVKENSVKQHLGILWLVLIPFSLWLVTHYQFSWNSSQSLAQRLFIIKTKQLPKKNDYVLFYAPQTSYFKQNDTLIKKVIGVAGDVVSRKGQAFYINGQYIGLAKTHSLKGRPLVAGPIGVIPHGKYFVWTEHVDSYDSRYQEIGWIDEKAILGVAYPLF